MRSKSCAGSLALIAMALIAGSAYPCRAAQQNIQDSPNISKELPSNLTVKTPAVKTAKIQAPPSHGCKLKSGPIKTVIDISDAATLQLDDNTELRLADLYFTRVVPPGNAQNAQNAQNAENQQNPHASKSPPVANNTAINFLQTLTLGKAVQLKFFKARRDRYGRRVAHPHVMTNGRELWVQAELVKHGYALVAANRADRNCVLHLLKLEKNARQNTTGYWGTHIFNIKKANKPKELLNDLHTFQIVGGRVKRISGNKSTIYLNFSGDWKNDFTIAISRRIQKSMNWDLAKFTRLKGRYVRIRGWIEENYGPIIRMRQPTDLEHDLDHNSAHDGVEQSGNSVQKNTRRK